MYSSEQKLRESSGVSHVPNNFCFLQEPDSGGKALGRLYSS